MPWTAFNAAQHALVDELLANPSRAIPKIESRLHRATGGERLRLLGMLTSAYYKSGRKDRALALVGQGDETPRTAQPFARAEFTIYTSIVIAQEGRPDIAIGRINAALGELIPTLSGKPTTGHARAALRRRQIAAANLHVTRGNIQFHEYHHPTAAAQDGVAALAALPAVKRLREKTRKQVERSQLASLSLLAPAIAEGARIPAGLREHLDMIEDVFTTAGLTEGIHAAQLARCRAFLLVRAGDVAAAEMLMFEALHWCIHAEAQTEFEQTLEMLTQIAGRRAGRLREEWRRRWAESPAQAGAFGGRQDWPMRSSGPPPRARF